MNWMESDIWKFTREHPDSDVESWGGYIGKNDGYTSFGYIVNYDNKRFFFNLNGNLAKTKAD